jgi:hypothetical protein
MAQRFMPARQARITRGGIPTNLTFLLTFVFSLGEWVELWYTMSQETQRRRQWMKKKRVRMTNWILGSIALILALITGVLAMVAMPYFDEDPLLLATDPAEPPATEAPAPTNPPETPPPAVTDPPAQPDPPADPGPPPDNSEG